MARIVDREVLVGFVEEAESYLPTIRRRIDALRADPQLPDDVEEAHRLIHTIKGAAAMVGLAGLSHIAYRVEEALEEIAAGQMLLDDAAIAFLHYASDQIEVYLDGVRRATLRERPLLEDVMRADRRLRGLPAEEDDQAIEAILKEEPPAAPAAAEKPATPMPPPRPAAEPAALEEVPEELIEAFALEAEDHLRTIASLLASLEKQPDKQESLQGVRRSIHTLKGAAGTIGLKSVAHLAHRMEDLLDLLYAGALPATPDAVELLADSTDALEDMVAGRADETAVAELYTRYANWLPQAAETAPTRKLEPLGPEAVIDLSRLASPLPESAERWQPVAEEHAPQAPRKPSPVVRVSIERLDELVRLVSEIVISRTAFEQRMADFRRTADELRLSVERLRRVSTTLETDYEVGALASDPGGMVARSTVANTHGFDALEFDRYTGFHRLTRELVETTSDVNTVGNELVNLLGDFDSNLNRQGRLSSELQDKLMRVRMVPLSTLAPRLNRAVRVLAREQDKKVELVTEGAEIELDKTVLEEMADPLLHLLRNAVIHGIEPPALRQVLGKPARGAIRLRAFHDGSQTVIRVGDDGAGLETQLLRSAAVAGGFVSAADAPSLTERDLQALIFLPGFTTAGEVSEASGRGVGLDIVRDKVHRLKGSVAVDSSPGEGMAVTIRLPVTLAVARSLLVRANGETFAVPLDAVSQILRLERLETEQVGKEQVVWVGGRVFPMLRLGDVLRLRQSPDETVQRPPVLILNAEGKQMALVVDHLLAGREIVIKTLGTHLRRVRGVAGATLMGDGSVVLILNPGDLVGGSPARMIRETAVRQVPHVMIVDDSMSVRRVVSNLIQSAGWRPLAARDGLEALEMIHRSLHPPDLILLDIEMPRMDGYEFMSALRSEPAYQAVPIVILTSRAGEKHRRKALELGASDYVVKPYQDEALLGMMRQLMPAVRSAVPA